MGVLIFFFGGLVELVEVLRTHQDKQHGVSHFSGGFQQKH